MSSEGARGVQDALNAAQYAEKDGDLASARGWVAAAFEAAKPNQATREQQQEIQRLAKVVR